MKIEIFVEGGPQIGTFGLCLQTHDVMAHSRASDEEELLRALLAKTAEDVRAILTNVAERNSK